MRTADAARGKWQSILISLGINAKHLVNKHGQCPLCGGNDRFRWDNKEGSGSYICGQCGAGDGMKLAIQYTGKPFREVAPIIDSLIGNAKEDSYKGVTNDAKKTKQRLKIIGSQLKPIGDIDPVTRYLKSRGIKSIPKEFIRYHPSLDYFEDGKRVGSYPAMVAAFRRSNGEIETFHVTYLDGQGEKAAVKSQRKVLGTQTGLNGCAIRLSPIQEHIGIAEGIETALSVTELYGIPCWACFSANSLATFEPPEGIKKISVFSDADHSFTGQHAATSACKRLVQLGYDVELAPFGSLGTDYNDMLEANK